MRPEEWQRVKAVCAAALDRGPAERAAYLDEACAGDAALRAEVESLIGAYNRAGEFIEQPAVAHLAAPLDALPSLDPNLGRSIGPYVVDDMIGRGGMGAVYLGRRADREFEQRVAIKMIRRGMDSDLVIRRFRHERQILASLDHPNIARLFDGGSTPDGLPYFVMEFVDGLPIDRYADEHRLSTTDRLRLCLGVFDAVQHAHARLIVHRDLKPSNVFVTAAGHPKLLDFGIAKILDLDGDRASTFTSVTRPMTPDYASPEQVRGQAITPATDVYALGLLLYELLTGHRPFHLAARTADEVARVVCEQDPERPSTVIERVDTETREDGTVRSVTSTSVSEIRDGSPERLRKRLTGALDAIVLKALRKEPEQRYPSVSALAEDVRRYLEEQPVEAGRGARRYRVARWARRRRTALATAALVLVAVGATALLTRGIGPAPDPTASRPAQNAPRQSVAVIGFRNLSGAPADAWLSIAIAEMLTTELAGDGQVRVVPSEQIARVVRDLRVDPGDAPSAGTLAALRKALGVDFLMLGTFAAAEGGDSRALRLDVRVHGAGDAPMAAAGSQGDESQLFSLVADAGRELRGRLGLKASSSEAMTAARAAFPASLDATRFYAEGMARLRVLDAVGARERLEQAAALEPSNPMVQTALASAWTALGYDARAASAAQQAFEASGALTREERLNVEGRLYEAQQQWPKAADVYRTLWGFFSDNVEYGLRLAAAQTASGRGKEALATIGALRAVPPPQNLDPRIDMQEADAAAALADFPRELAALQRARASAEQSGAQGLLARARLLEGRSHFNQGQPGPAVESLEAAQRLFQEVGDRAGAASALNSLGTLLADQQDLARAVRMYEESLKTSEEIGDRRAMSAVLNNLGIIYKDQRRFDDARKAHERALALRREIGDRNWTAVSLSNIGVVLFEQDKFSEAAKYYNESLALSREIGDRRGQVRAEHNLAIVDREVGNLASARRGYEESLAIRREIGDRRGETMGRVELGMVLFAQGELDAARRMEEDALELARETRLKPGEAQALFQLAEIALASGDVETARRQHEAALAVRREIGETRTVLESQAALAALTLEEGRPADAERDARTVLEALGGEPTVALRVPLGLLVARSRMAAGDLDGAAPLLASARTLAARTERVDIRRAVSMADAEFELARGQTRQARERLTNLAATLNRAGMALAELDRRLLLLRVDAADRRAVRARRDGPRARRACARRRARRAAGAGTRAVTARPCRRGPCLHASARCGVDGRDEVLGCDRFRNVRVESRRERLQPVVQPRVRRDRDGRHAAAAIRRPLPNLPQQFVAVHARQAEIGDQDVRRARLELPERVGRRRHGPDVGAGVFEGLPEQLQRVFLVVHEQDVESVEPFGPRHRRSVRGRVEPGGVVRVRIRLGHHGHLGASRNCTTNRAPCPGPSLRAPDGPAVQLHELLADREAEAEPAVLPREPAVGLQKRLEHVRQEMGRDPDAGVAHRHADDAVALDQRHHHPSALRGELHGVRQQVPEDLLQPSAVAPDHALDRSLDLERDPFGLGRRPHALERLFERSRDEQRPDFQPHFSGRDPRDVEQVLHQLVLDDGVALDDLDGPRPLFERQRVGPQHPRVAEDRVQRRAQLVRQRRHELVLHAVGGLRGVARPGQRLLGQLALGDVDADAVQRFGASVAVVHRAPAAVHPAPLA